jgi:hypothetical protein
MGAMPVMVETTACKLFGLRFGDRQVSEPFSSRGALFILQALMVYGFHIISFVFKIDACVTLQFIGSVITTTLPVDYLAIIGKGKTAQHFSTKPAAPRQWLNGGTVKVLKCNLAGTATATAAVASGSGNGLLGLPFGQLQIGK